jgi:predicted NBD/HSP70 family sugar kinase
MTDKRNIRSINRAAILDLIRTNEPISRTKIALQLGISLPTVLRIVDDLIREGLIITDDKKEKGGGRPGELLRFNGGYYSILCIDLGCPEMIGMISDLCGNILHEIRCPLIPGNGKENLKYLENLIDALLKKAKDGQHILKGIGLGIPGGNDIDAGVVLESTYLGWENVPLSRRLNRRFHVPVYIDSDINLFTLGENGFGAAKGLQNFICLTLGSKILCGMMINGEIYRGHHFQAGSLGSTFPSVTMLKDWKSGVAGALDSIASGTSTYQHAITALEKHNPAALSKMVDMLSVYQAAADGDIWAKEIIEEVALHISHAISNLTLILDPEVIVLTGKAANAGETIKNLIYQNLQGKLPFLPEIKISDLGTRSIVCGAIMLIYRGTFVKI